MSHQIVKILTNDDGDKSSNKKWHYVQYSGGSPNTLCTNEVFGFGEGGATFLLKEKEKGGITCNDCLIIIKNIKQIKL